MAVVSSVERALSILQAFMGSESEVTLAMLAERTGLYKSTILRLAATLELSGFVVRKDNGAWRLGPMIPRLAQRYQASFHLGEVIEPVLRRLVVETGESASFYVRDGEVRVCLYRVDSPKTVRDFAAVGDVLPLTVGANGAVLQAFSGAKGREFEDVRRNYIAYNFGLRLPSAAGISCPVFAVNQRLVGSMSVSGPKERFTRSIARRFEVSLRRAAAGVTQALGGDGQPILAGGPKN